MSNLLLHICCGVCAVGLVDKFRKDGIKVTGYFYNPNIHPFMEFKKRLRAVEVLSEQEKLPIHYERSYGLDDFLGAVAPFGRTGAKARCLKCYQMRLSRAAQKARELRFDSFTSTLIVSPQQDQAVIRDIGVRIARDAGISFKYEAITELYSKCHEIAKKRQLYRQQYCGCVFSEYERYNKETKNES